MQKPFIQLFRTPNCNYFLEVNKNEFVQIGDESFRYLDKLLARGDDSEDSEPMPQELVELQTAGYLATKSVVETVKHPYSDFIEVFLERKMAGITLQLTQDCNLRCSYCAYTERENTRQRQHSKEKMSWKTAKKAIDFLWERSIDSPSINIGFYGGEPLLEFSLLQQIAQYCLERFSGKELSFHMTTNGTLLNDEMLVSLEKYGVIVSISLDGPKEINDLNRVFEDGSGTFDVVMKKVQRAKEIAPKLAERMKISMVVDPENDFDCINSICLEGADLDKLMITATIVDYDYEDRTVSFSNEYSSKFEYQSFLSILSYYNRFPHAKLSPLTENYVERLRNDCFRFEGAPGLFAVDVPSGPCVPGHFRLFIDVYGRFFPCERVNENALSMVMGTLDEGFNFNSANEILNIGSLTEEECKNCWCFRTCFLCVKQAEDGTSKLSPTRKLSRCGDVRGNAYNMLQHHLLFLEIPQFYTEHIYL